MRGANAKLSPLDPLSLRLIRATSTSTMRKSTNCTSPVSFVKLKKSTWSRMPMAIAPTTARGNDVMPPISAAASPRSSVSGPMCTRSAERLVGGDR